MTLIQEQAMDLIKKTPDEKYSPIYYLINLLNDLLETTPTYRNEPTKAQKAYENLQKFRHRGTVDRDYKVELYSALEEKYDSMN